MNSHTSISHPKLYPPHPTILNSKKPNLTPSSIIKHIYENQHQASIKAGMLYLHLVLAQDRRRIEDTKHYEDPASSNGQFISINYHIHRLEYKQIKQMFVSY